VTRRVALSRVPLSTKVKSVPQDGVRTFLPSSVISGLVRIRLTTGTSDHPARPPFQLYSEISSNGLPGQRLINFLVAGSGSTIVAAAPGSSSAFTGQYRNSEYATTAHKTNRTESFP